MCDFQFVLPLAASLDAPQVGGKSAALAHLLGQGFRVPPGICITTAAYDAHCRAAGLDAEATWLEALRARREERARIMAECREIILRADLSEEFFRLLNDELRREEWRRTFWWAVRSSGTTEDQVLQSMAGLYETALGVSTSGLRRAIPQRWADLWSDRATDYLIETGRTSRLPKMAVLIQPMIPARAAGVLFSRSPVNPRRNVVMINAVPGLGAPLVAGTIAPDEYVLAEEGGQWSVSECRIQAKRRALYVREQGLITETLEGDTVTASTLTEQELLELAATGRTVEAAMGYPVDIEWAFDDRGLWLLQARPITATTPDAIPADMPGEIPRKSPQTALNNRTSYWSRANFKETLPEVPSRLSTTFLEEYMENNILTHYRALGCVIPPELTPVRVIEGRPFINVTLFQSLVAQLGGDPSDVIERMGGQGTVSEHLPDRLPLWKVIRAGLLVEVRIRHAIRTAPSWFAEIKQLGAAMAREAQEYSKYHLDVLLQRVQSLGNLLKRRDLTFAIVAGVGQGFQILGSLLPRALGPDSRILLNRALQGQGTIISAKQIELIQQLARLAAEEATIRDYFQSEQTEWREFRTLLTGTTFLSKFEAFLAEYGHRGIGESDFIAPRHADRPDYLMLIIRSHLQTSSTNPTPPDRAARQEQIRDEALSEIRRRLGWRPLLRLLFRWTYRRLTHCLSLREANRHHVMYFSTMVRDLMLAIGGHLVAQGKIEQQGDVFFLTADETRSLTERSSRDLRQLVEMRRQERAAHMRVTVPDYVGPESREPVEREPATDRSGILQGIPISTGQVQGLVRVIRSPDDLRTVERGEILVVPVIDPGLAPLFGLVGGLIAEMGGTLSHGAIIAREYGLPTIANVRDAMQIFQTGDIVHLDATSGEIRRVE